MVGGDGVVWGGGSCGGGRFFGCGEEGSGEGLNL